MAALAVLRDPGALAELGEALQQHPEWVIGVWIDGGATDMAARLARVPALALQAVRQTDRWSVCRIETASHVTLLDLLMYVANAAGTHPAGRFVPIFRADDDAANRRAAWQQLAHRYPGAVLPLMVQDAHGVLHYDDLEGLAA